MVSQIVVVGSSNTDMVAKTERMPMPGETVFGEFVMAPGGKGANQAVAAARLGAEVTLIARIGNDVFGDLSFSNFEREGIRTDFMVRDSSTHSGVALIFVDAKGENSIVVASGANGRLAPEDVDRAQEALAECKVLLLQLEIPLETVFHAASIAAKHGVKIILTPAPVRQLPAELLGLVDVLVPNETEAAALLDLPSECLLDNPQAAAGLLDLGVASAVVTLGSRGALIVTREGNQLLPAIPVKAVDTTAAGDAFTGALSVALARGESIRKAVEFAVAAAAVSVTRMGAQPSLPTESEVLELLKEVVK
ncbi:MAG: ribokinase [Armatimonadetes bacterium]|nr:ribokinase [Armatimonadota bacterium]